MCSLFLVRYEQKQASQSFICRCRKVDRTVTDGLHLRLHLDIGNGVSLEKVNKSGYLGDTSDADGGCDSVATARVKFAWKVSSIPTHSNWKRILVKTERQGICYLCEELSDAWQWDLAYESRAWIEAESHWNEYDQGLSRMTGRKVKNSENS